jgi:hypothetical protein
MTPFSDRQMINNRAMSRARSPYFFAESSNM